MSSLESILVNRILAAVDDFEIASEEADKCPEMLLSSPLSNEPAKIMERYFTTKEELHSAWEQYRNFKEKLNESI